MAASAALRGELRAAAGDEAHACALPPAWPGGAVGGGHGGELRVARGGAGGDATTGAADSVERDDSESLYGEEGRLCCFLAVNVSQLHGCKGSSGPRQMPGHIE